MQAVTIQIDDAGWGCLLGGVLIGAYREEQRQFEWGEVPVEHFQGTGFARKGYLQVAVDITRALFERLEVGKDEPIRILRLRSGQACTGYVLSGVRDWLGALGYTWETAKIEGPLQVLVETTLLQKLHALGVDNVDYETLTQKQGLLFWKCLRWLKGGNINATKPFLNRDKHAKTGWRNYDIWISHPYKRAKALKQERERAQRRAW